MSDVFSEIHCVELFQVGSITRRCSIVNYIDEYRSGYEEKLRNELKQIVNYSDKYRSDYEEKLRNELEQLRIRTDAEIDRLKTSTREMYERENRFDYFIFKYRFLI